MASADNKMAFEAGLGKTHMGGEQTTVIEHTQQM